jgi:hypothetical protein
MDDKSNPEGFKKCDSRFGISDEERNFSVSSAGYVQASTYVMDINKLNGYNGSYGKVCGYKMSKINSCYYFIDFNENRPGGHEVCVHPKNYSLTLYKLDI